MTGFPVPPTRLPGLASLLAGELWSSWAGAGKVFPLDDFRSAVRYVRLKPSTSCRLAVFDDRTESGFIIYLYSQAERAVEALGKIAPREARAFVSRSAAAVVVPFPCDVELPGLRHLYRSYRLKQALWTLLPEYPQESWRIRKRLTSLKLLAYKPGRRAVFRVETQLERLDGTAIVRAALHIKVGTPPTFHAAQANLAAVHAAVPSGAEWGVPAPAGVVDSRCLTARRWVEGGALAAPEVFHATGRALAGLHRLDIDLGQHGYGLHPDGLREHARDLAGLMPEDEARILSLGERIAEETSRYTGPCCPVHGDFHPGQVVVDDSRPVLIDFDRAGVGNPALDVGSFVAYTIELGLGSSVRDAFVAGYRDEAPWPVDPGLSATTAAVLFRRASVPFRELRPDWPRRIRQRLEQVEQHVGACTR